MEITKRLTTTDAVATEIAAIPLEDGDVVKVEAWVVARERTGADRALYHIEGLFYRQGGAAVQQGVTVSHTLIESDAAYAADFAVSGNDIQIKVTGKAAITVDWKAHYDYVLLQIAA